VILVLSLFPGAGLLDRGFTLEGFCIVRGPDTLLGGRIEEFNAPAGHFNGIIGGPPCQDFSRARREPPTGHGLKMIREFARVVTEAQPAWWLMENVSGVPSLSIPWYKVQRFNLYAPDFGLRQKRNRAFQFGCHDGVFLVLERPIQSQLRAGCFRTLTCQPARRNFADFCEAQGLPRDFDLPGLSRTAKYRAVGNGVPIPMARAVARAIRSRHNPSSVTRLCVCGCGRPVTGKAVSAAAACRKRIERSRKGLVPVTLEFSPSVPAGHGSLITPPGP
jgi:DNA (cytosine-5)-methyltransferase 1